MPHTHTIADAWAGLALDDLCSPISLVNQRTGTEWLAAGRVVPIFEIRLGDPAEPNPDRILGSWDFRLEVARSSGDALVVEGECESVHVELGISLTGSGLSEWRLEVLNRGQAEVTEVLFPILSGLTPPEAGCGFTIPANNGWWLPYDLLDDDESLTWNYPIFGSMQWIDLGGRNEGLYVGCHDTEPLIKLMTAGKRSGRGHVAVRFTDVGVRPGERLALPPVVIGPHAGDWRAGARIYREWAESWMEKPEIPEWALRKPHWAWMGMKSQFAGRPERTYEDLPRESDAAAEYGIHVLNVGGWTEHGHDARYPDYVAGDCLGGEEGLIRAVREIHARGHRIILYTNGRLADPDSSLRDVSNWLSWAVRGLSRGQVEQMQKLHANFDVQTPGAVSWDPDGVIVKEHYGIDFAVMCPSCREWREYFTRKMCYLVEKYEVDGVYLDQVCGCWSYPCRAESHDHRRPNESWRGYVDLLRELRAGLREINPHICVATEGVGDLFGQYLDMLQGHNDWDTQVGDKARPMPELFRYTFPWLVVCSGPVYPHRPDLLRLAHLVGSGYDFCTMPPTEATPEVLAQSEKVLEWRERFWREMALGEFLGPCETSHPDYRAFAFEGEERTVVTLAWVPWKSDPAPPDAVTLAVPSDHPADRALLLTEEGEIEPAATSEAGRTRVTIPFAEVAVLVI